MTIDPTKDIVTEEEYSRPVMLLYALGNDTPYGFIVFNITKTATDEFWLMTDENRPNIRNVVPPKPEPVLYVKWCLLEVNGTLLYYADEAEARSHQDDVTAECRRIAWMSDGSPVPASPEEYDHIREMAKVIQERDEWKIQCEQWAAKSSAWTIEKDALKASLEEARQQQDDTVPAADAERLAELLLDAQSARDTWRTKAEGLTGVVDKLAFSLQQSTAKVKALEAKMMGPVKNCTTCGSLSDKATCRKGCWSQCIHSEYGNWGPRHD